MGSSFRKLRKALEPDQKLTLPSSESVPWRIVGIIYAVIMGDALAGEMLSPFVADMCKTRFGMTDAETGTALGFLVGCYYMAQFLSSFLIGHISDRVGRRIPLTMGQVASCAGTILFALAPSYSVALLIRGAVGLTNSNIAVARAAICDAAIGKARTLSLSYMGSLYALSRAVATAFSGFTVGTVIIADNPYLFPCLLGGSFIFIVIIATCLVFPETQTKEQRLANRASSDKGLLAGLKYIIGEPLLRKLFTLHCIHSFCNGSILIGMTMFFSLSIDLNGLSFTTRDIGIVFGVFGLAGFLFQLTLFRTALERWGVHGTYSRGLIVSLVSTLAVPFTGAVYQIMGAYTVLAHSLTWIFVIIVSAGCGISFMMGLSVLGSMLANAADQTMQGLTQGANQSFSSLLRAVGPMICGIIFAFSISINLPHIMFAFLSLLYFGCFILAISISQEDRRRAEKTPQASSPTTVAATVESDNGATSIDDNHQVELDPMGSAKLLRKKPINLDADRNASTTPTGSPADTPRDHNSDEDIVSLDTIDIGGTDASVAETRHNQNKQDLSHSVEVLRRHL